MRRVRKLLACLFPFRARVRELERRIKRLEEARARPTLSVDDRGLFQVSSRHFQSLPDAGIIGRVDCAKELLDDEINIVNFMLYLETTEGTFKLPLREGNEIEFDQSEEDFRMIAHFSSIDCGRALTVLDSAITYRGKVMNRIDNLHGIQMLQGDALNVHYTFTN